MPCTMVADCTSIWYAIHYGDWLHQMQEVILTNDTCIQANFLQTDDTWHFGEYGMRVSRKKQVQS